MAATAGNADKMPGMKHHQPRKEIDAPARTEKAPARGWSCSSMLQHLAVGGGAC
jgi:hypothetical protein